jgi:hypothetical protein
MKAILCAAAMTAAFLMSPAIYADSTLVGSGAFTTPPVITFETIANGEVITNQYASLGVVFSGFSGDTGDNIFFSDSGNVVASNFTANGTQIPATLTFSTFYTLVGFEIVSNGDTTLNVTGDDGVTDTFVLNARPTSSTGIFVGFDDPAGITEISIGPSAVNDDFAIDNVQLEAPVATPEPGTAGLMLPGFGLLFVMRKRIGQALSQAS